MKTLVVALIIFCMSQISLAQVLRDQRDRSLLKEEKPRGEKTLIHTVQTIKSPVLQAYDKQVDGWDQLLKLHVAGSQGVAYVGMEKDFAILDAFILAHNKLKMDDLNDDARLAIYINLYNAGMIYNILKYAQAKKISVGSEDFLKLQINSLDISEDIWSNQSYSLPLSGRQVTLDGIEHGLIRKQKKPGRSGFPLELEKMSVRELDPRIHVAVNCAARSCPPIREIAYRPETVRKMLQENMISFVNDQNQFAKMSDTKLEANKIIFWYYTDFNQAAKKIGNLKSAGDYFATFIDSTSSDGDWKRRHFLANFNDRSIFALRFTSDFNWQYDWLINDKRNFLR